MGCKSIYVFNDSEIKTAEDLKGKTIAIHDGIGNSDQNIIYPVSYTHLSECL